MLSGNILTDYFALVNQTEGYYQKGLLHEKEYQKRLKELGEEYTRRIHSKIGEMERELGFRV